MKMQRIAITIIFLTIGMLALTTIGLAGCENGPLLSIVDRNTDERNTGVLSQPGEKGAGFSKLGDIEVGIEPTPVPAKETYTNEIYDFQFQYPQTWALTQEDHVVILVRETDRLTIKYRWVDEDIPPFRTGLGAGDLVYAGKIDFLGQVIPAQILLYDLKTKAVFYGISSEIPAAGLLFTIMLEDLDNDYLEVNLSDEVIDEAAAILGTFKWNSVKDQEKTTSNDSALYASLGLKDSQVHAVGDPVIIQFTLENRSQEALYLLPWYTPLEGIKGNIFEVQRDGQPVSYLGIFATRANPTGDSYLYIEPGQTISAEVDIAQSYNLSQPGTYTIRLRPPRISCLAASKSDLATTLDELGPVNIPSDEVSVQITESIIGKENYSPVTTEQARELISVFLSEQKPGLVQVPLILLEEKIVDSLWEDLQGQIFVLNQGIFENDAFLIRHGLVIPLGDATGGKGLISAMVSDVDEDGTAELFFTYSTGLSPQLGAGMQSRVGMYNPVHDETGITEADLAYLGTAAVTGKDTAFVSLDAVEIDEGGETHLIDALGQLFLEKKGTGVTLKFHINSDMPADLRRNILINE